MKANITPLNNSAIIYILLLILYTPLTESSSSLPLIHKNPELTQKIISAIQSADKKNLKKLLDNETIDINNISNHSLLHEALTPLRTTSAQKKITKKTILSTTMNPILKVPTHQSRINIITMLLKRGIDPNREIGDDYSLNIAVKLEDEALTKLLLLYKADCNQPEPLEPHNTPLINAVIKENNAITTLLLEHNALTDDQNKEGDTALLVALKQHNSLLSHTLITAKANPFIINNCGDTAFSFLHNIKDSDDFIQKTDQWVIDQANQGELTWYPGNNIHVISIAGLKKSLILATEKNLSSLAQHITATSSTILKHLVKNNRDETSSIQKIKQLFKEFTFSASSISKLLITAIKEKRYNMAQLLCHQLKSSKQAHKIEIKKIKDKALLYNQVYQFICNIDEGELGPREHCNSITRATEESKEQPIEKEVSDHYIKGIEFSRHSFNSMQSVSAIEYHPEQQCPSEEEY